MTTEEKAKAYDEALEKARIKRDEYKRLDPKSYVPQDIEYIFPELRESEDERIRKSLIGIVEQFMADERKEKTLAWLEKQKEQKPVNHNLTTWHRDVVYSAMCDKNLDEGLRCNLEVVYKTIKELVDRTPVVEEQKPAWSEEDEKRIKQLIYDTEHIKAEYEKKKEQLGERFNDALIKDCDEQIAWLKSLRPCPSWKPSELEKGALRTAIHILTDERSFPRAAAQLQNILDAFEGKESRKDWKPSKKHLDALNFAIAYFMYKTSYKNPTELRELYEQLKKL